MSRKKLNFFLRNMTGIQPVKPNVKKLFESRGLRGQDGSQTAISGILAAMPAFLATCLKGMLFCMFIHAAGFPAKKILEGRGAEDFITKIGRSCINGSTRVYFPKNGSLYGEFSGAVLLYNMHLKA